MGHSHRFISAGMGHQGEEVHQCRGGVGNQRFIITGVGLGGHRFLRDRGGAEAYLIRGGGRGSSSFHCVRHYLP